MKRVLAIDANNLITRCFHGVPLGYDRLRRPQNAIRGWLNSWMLLTDDLKPDVVAAVFDGGRDLERSALLPQYKAHRAEKPGDLVEQIEVISLICDKMGMTLYQRDGTEADDLLFTISRRVPEQAELLILSQDKDLAQCVKTNVRLARPRNGAIELWDSDSVEKEYGVRPEQIPIYLALVGDSSDNIPGVPHVGPKGAAELLKFHPSIEELSQNPRVYPHRENFYLSLEVTRCKEIPSVPWPDHALKTNWGFLDSFCRDRGLVRMAEALGKRAPDPDAQNSVQEKLKIPISLQRAPAASQLELL